MAYIPKRLLDAPSIPWSEVRKEQLAIAKLVEKMRAQKGKPTKPKSTGPIKPTSDGDVPK